MVDDPQLEFDPVCASLFEPELPCGVTVLYIEDNAINTKLVGSFLAEQPELRFMAAKDGGTGLAMAYEHRPDVILLDVHLPDLPGSEALRRLRANRGLAAVPVIVASADVSDQQIRKMSSFGISEYLTKPSDLVDLKRAIHDVLGTCLAG